MIQLSKSYIWNITFGRRPLNRGTDEKAVMKLRSQPALDDSDIWLQLHIIIKFKKHPWKTTKNKNPFKHVKVFPRLCRQGKLPCTQLAVYIKRTDTNNQKSLLEKQRWRNCRGQPYGLQKIIRQTFCNLFLLASQKKKKKAKWDYRFRRIKGVHEQTAMICYY